MADTKQAYVSPPTGTLDLTIIRDARPRVSVSLDLGIPNFTVFSMTFPFVEGQPAAMSGLISEAVNVLLDEVASFMMSMEFSEEITVQIYATVLAAFKSMSKEADTSKEQDETGADPTVKTYEGTFKLPMAFVNETQKKVVTAAYAFENLSHLKKRIETFLRGDRKKFMGLPNPTHDRKVDQENAKQLAEYQRAHLKKFFEAAAPYFENEPMFEDDYSARYRYDEAKRRWEEAEEFIRLGRHDKATGKQERAIESLWNTVSNLAKLEQEYHEHFTAATKIKRLPKTRHIELTYEPKAKTTVSDAARVIRQYRNRSLKQQPKPLYVIVYDQMGRPTGTLSLGPQFKNRLLQLMTKRAAVEFVPPLSFLDELALKNQLLPPGIPETISVGGMTYLPEAVAGHDMALYHGPQDYLVKFVDGRSAIFPGRPTFRNMRRLNFPVPRNRFKWTILPPPEPKPEEQSIKLEEAPKQENKTMQNEVRK